MLEIFVPLISFFGLGGVFVYLRSSNENILNVLGHQETSNFTIQPTSSPTLQSGGRLNYYSSSDSSSDED